MLKRIQKLKDRGSGKGVNMHEGWYTNGWFQDCFYVWWLRLTLTKLDDMGLIYLKIGQRFEFKNILGRETLRA